MAMITPAARIGRYAGGAVSVPSPKPTAVIRKTKRQKAHKRVTRTLPAAQPAGLINR